MAELLHTWGLRFENPHFIWWQSFASFGFLLLLAMIAVTAAIWWFWWRGRVEAVKSYGTPDLVQRWTALPGKLGAVLVLAGLVSVLVLGLTAATMPFKPLGAVSVPSGSIRVVGVFDATRSMSAENREDPPLYGGRSCTMVEGPCGRRIEIARLVLQNQIMPAIKGNQLGVVVFAGSPVTKSHLNDDFEPINTMLNTGWVDYGTAMGEGTYVADALNAALKIFARNPAKSGESDVILLFTDGENHSPKEDMEKAIDAARKAGVLVIVVGIGSTSPQYIPLYDGNDKPLYEKDGKRTYHRMANGKLAETARDDAAMIKLASDLGGRYVKVVPGEALKIDWPSSIGGSKVEIAKQYLYGPMIAAMLVIIALIWMLGTLVERVTAGAVAGAKRLGFRNRVSS